MLARKMHYCQSPQQVPGHLKFPLNLAAPVHVRGRPPPSLGLFIVGKTRAVTPVLRPSSTFLQLTAQPPPLVSWSAPQKTPLPLPASRVLAPGGTHLLRDSTPGSEAELQPARAARAACWSHAHVLRPRQSLVTWHSRSGRAGEAPWGQWSGSRPLLNRREDEPGAVAGLPPSLSSQQMWGEPGVLSSPS